jgi:hypothetical protein
MAAGLSADSAAQPVDAYDALLRRHVQEGFVEYEAFAGSPGFKEYLASLAEARPDAKPEPERLAFWINAYNAYTIHLINVRGERESIRNIAAPTAGGNGPWSQPIARVGGRTYTLDEIEHQVIRKQFKEPRIHFALVCAAAGCPPLRSEAYAAARLDTQLDDQAREFLLRSPEKNRVDVDGGVVHLSPILDWFREDFGGNDAALGRFVARYHPDGPARRLLAGGRFRISWTGYDWSLNSRARLGVASQQVFERLLRLSDAGDLDPVRRSTELLAPVLEEHVRVLGSPLTPDVTTLLRSSDRQPVQRGVRLLVAREVVVMLRGALAASAPDEARTSLKTAGLHWELLRPQLEAARGRAVSDQLAAIAAALDAGKRQEARAALLKVEVALLATP